MSRSRKSQKSFRQRKSSFRIKSTITRFLPSLYRVHPCTSKQASWRHQHFHKFHRARCPLRTSSSPWRSFSLSEKSSHPGWTCRWWMTGSRAGWAVTGCLHMTNRSINPIYLTSHNDWVQAQGAQRSAVLPLPFPTTRNITNRNHHISKS